MSEENKQEQDAPRGRVVIFMDEIVNTITGESYVTPEEIEKEFGDLDSPSNLWNSAPSEELNEKRGNATHVVRTKCGYDLYFHLGVG